MLHNLTRRLVGALGIAALAMACWQMAERYLLPKLGSVWIEETVIYLFAWGTFLAVALLVQEDKHVRADVIVRLLPAHLQRRVELLNCLLGFFFCAVVAWFGGVVAVDAFSLDERSVTGSSIPIWFFYASLPVGMSLSAAWYLRQLYRLAFRVDPRTFSIRSGHDA